MDKAEIERLKRAIARDRRGSIRPGVPFNARLRAKILAHTEGRLQSGESLVTIAASLGIKYDTLRYWIEGSDAKRVKKASGFRQVRVVESQAGAATGVTLFGPGGTRVDGLSLNQAAELLRRMS